VPHDPLGRIGGIRRRFFADPGSRLPRDDALAAEAEHHRSSDGFAVLALLAAFDRPLSPMHRDCLAGDPRACDPKI
jgi:hypothetical protein